MKKNLLFMLLAASMLFTSAVPASAENEIPESIQEAADENAEAEAVEEIEEIEDAEYVGAVGDAELVFADDTEELVSEETADVSSVGVYAYTGTNGLPVLNIVLNGVTLEEIKAGTKDISYKGGSAELSEDGSASVYENTTIKGRGNSTWYRPKKPFQLKFNKKQDLFGQGKAKKWILLANYMDFTHLRNDIAFRLAVQNALPNALPQGQFIEVYFDGAYEGLYYLTRKVEIGTVPLEDEKGIIVEIEQLHTPDELYRYSASRTRVMLKETVIDSDVEAEQLAVLDNFMVTYNQFETAAKNRDWDTVRQLADVDSFAKYFLLSDFSSNQDMFGSSCYMYKDGDNDVIHAGPMWDFDLAYACREYLIAPESINPFRTWAYMDIRETASSLQLRGWAYLYEYLMNIPEFRNLVRETYWNSVRAAFLDIDDYVTEKSAELEGAAMRDADKWHPDLSVYEETVKLCAFLQDRVSYFNLLYGVPQELDGFYTLEGAYGSLTIYAEKGSDGFYTLRDSYGNVLGTASEGKENGSLVQWCSENSESDAQKWLYLESGALVGKETGLLLTQAGDGSLAIKNASIENETLSDEQTFSFVPAAYSDIASGTVTVPKVVSNAGEASPVLSVFGIVLTEGADYTLETTVTPFKVLYKFTGTGSYEGTITSESWLANEPALNSSSVYRLTSAINSSKVLTVKSGSLTRSANVQLETFSNMPEDLWTLEKQDDGTFVIRNLRSGLVLDIAGGRTSNGANVQQYTANGTAAQKFLLNELPDGSVEIINSRALKVLDVAGGRQADGTNVQLYTENGSKAQRWQFTEVGTLPDISGNHIIMSALGNADKALSVAGTSKYNNANVLIWDGAVSASAAWTIQKNTDGTYSIKNVHSGKALDVVNTGTKAGTNVQQFMFGSGKTAQKWILLEHPDSTFTIYSVCSGLALDVAGARNKNGSNVQIYTPNGSTAQKWVIAAS